MISMTPKLGIIAGGGDLPRLIIQSCQQKNRPYFILALEGQTPAELCDGHPHAWVYPGKLKTAFKLLRDNSVHEVVMAGNMRRPAWSEIKLDLKAAALFAKNVHRVFGDDSFLSGMVEIFEDEGFNIVGAHSVVENLLATEGVFGSYKPTKQQMEDIKHGLKVATILGQADVGQSVVVQEGLVLGVEAIEGTKALIDRCANLKRKGSAPVLVKISKPHQEKRVDLPTIGLLTIEQLSQAGFSGLAIEAGAALVLNKDDLVKEADRRKLFVIGVSRESA